MPKPFIVACIPAYNEERRLPRVILDTIEFVDKIIVYDDGSTDKTAKIAEIMGCIVIRGGKNKGYGAAIKYLIEKAAEINAEIAVTIDSDGQHDPSEIPKLLEPLVDGEADIVIGSRFIGQAGRGNMPKYRDVGIRVITKIANLTSYDGITDAQSGFRAYSRKALQCIHLGEYGMGVSTEILVKARDNNLEILEVPITVTYDDDSSTHNAVIHGVDVATSTIKYATLRHPLLSYGLPGVICLAIAGFFWLWTFDIFASTRQLITNIALVAIGSTVVGLILVTTSIILYTIITVVREK